MTTSKSGRGGGRGGYGGARSGAAKSRSPPGLLDVCADQFHKLRPELEAALKASGDAGATPADFQKMCQRCHHSIMKFSSSAAVTEQADIETIKPVAEEVTKNFVAVLGTLLALKLGAGKTLGDELISTADQLSTALVGLGKAAGTPGMAVAAGKALEKIKRLEKAPLDNKKAINKKILALMKQLKDNRRELRDALDEPCDDDDALKKDLDDEDDLSFTKAERYAAETLEKCSEALEALLKQALHGTVAISDEEARNPECVERIEAMTLECQRLVAGMDEMIMHSVGGYNVLELQKVLGTFQSGMEICRQSLPEGVDDAFKEFQSCVKNLEAAAVAVVEE